MIYEYNCPGCGVKFEVIKHHTRHRDAETCHHCGVVADRRISAPMLNKQEHAEFNHGLGCVVRDKKHREEICKQRGLIEIGNEKTEKTDNQTHEKILSWDGVI